MIKTARQLKDLIRNLSKDKSADAQILMRNYMMERFLERISLSEYREMQCFRHCTDEAIAERKTYSEEQKTFLVDYGLTIVKAIHELIK